MASQGYINNLRIVLYSSVFLRPCNFPSLSPPPPSRCIKSKIIIHVLNFYRLFIYLYIRKLEFALNKRRNESYFFRSVCTLISMNLIRASAWSAGCASTHCINTIIVHKYSSTFNIRALWRGSLRRRRQWSLVEVFRKSFVPFVPLHFDVIIWNSFYA